MLSSKPLNPDQSKRIVGAFPNAFQAWTRNLPVTVQKVGPGDFEQHQGFLVGNLRKDNLILGGFQNVAFGLGQQLIVRMVVDKKALGFQTTITGVLDMPESLFIGTFPGEMETLNLRSSERINVFFPSTVRATVGHSEDPRVHMISSRVLNIGSGGCRFSSKQPLEPETEISISFSLPEERHVLTLVGRVLGKEQRQSVYSHSTAFPNRADNLLGRSEIESWVCQNVAFCAE